MVFVLALAMTAIAASSALAAPEWQSESGNVWKQLGSTLTVHATGELAFDDTHMGGAKCKTAETVGTLEAGGLGKINSLKLENCTPLGSCSSVTSVTGINLPWKTQLTGSSVISNRIENGGTGTPGLYFVCTSSGLKLEDTCDFAKSAEIFNPGLGEVQQNIEGPSTVGYCSRGGTETGQWEGRLTIAHPAGVQGIRATGVAAPTVKWGQAGSALSTSVGTVSKGTLKIVDAKASVTVECETTEEGTAGPGVADSATKFTASKCVSNEICTSPAVEALGISWHSELSNAFEAIQDVTSQNGHGAPGFKLKCTLLGVKYALECTATTLLGATSNVSGGVNAAYDGELLKCVGNGKETTAVLEGTQLVEATSGGKLEVL